MPVFGDKPIDEISRSDIKDFLYAKQSEKLAPGTVRIIRAYLTAILTEAVDDELITYNPAARTGRFICAGEVRKKANPPSWEERTRLEKAAQTHFARYYPLFFCENRTGLRFGELTALKAGDIDFGGRDIIEVKRNAVRGEITSPKNGKTRRVDMSKQLAPVLKSHLLERKKEAFKNGRGNPPEWLFYNEQAGLIDNNKFRKRVFHKVLEKAGLRHTRIHDLRHTYLDISDAQRASFQLRARLWTAKRRIKDTKQMKNYSRNDKHSISYNHRKQP